MLVKHVRAGAKEEAGVRDFADELEMESAIAELDLDALEGDRPGTPSEFSCPSCEGVLWEIEEGPLLRFRCRVGHAWSAESLAAEHTETVERSMWATVRGLKERAALATRLAERAERRGRSTTAEQFRRHAADAEELAELVGKALDAADASGVAVDHGTGDESVDTPDDSG
jgi:two-component system chemotaxis response regulator CheB